MLRDQCHEWPPFLKDRRFVVEGPILISLNMSAKSTCLGDHILMTDGAVFQHRFHNGDNM